MKSHLRAFFIGGVVVASFLPVCHLVCQKDKEDVFAVKNYYNNRVFVDGKEVRSIIIDGPTLIYGFCIPHRARLIAVTNVLDILPPVSLLGSMGERLLTNSEWRCVNDDRGGDWYQPWYNDTNWPRAYSKKPLTTSPFISKNAMSISSVQNNSNKYYCRARIKEKLETSKPLKRSAFATRMAQSQRLVNHVIQSLLVDDIMECLARCLDYDQCVSLNTGTSHQQGRKSCDLNDGTFADYPHDMEQSSTFDHYNIIKV